MWRLEKHALDSIRCQYERVLWRVPMGSGLFKLLQVPTPGKWQLVSVTAALFVRSRFRNCPNYPNLHYMITHPSACRHLEFLFNLWLFINQKGKMSNMNANPTCFDPQPAVLQQFAPVLQCSQDCPRHRQMSHPPSEEAGSGAAVWCEFVNTATKALTWV